MKKATLIHFFLLAVCTAQAQTNLDSLYTLWQDENQADSTRVWAYADYIWSGYLYSKPDTAVILADALHSYAEEYQFLRASSIAYNLQGNANYLQGNYPGAIACHQKSMAISEEMGNKSGVATALGNIGTIYKIQGNYSRALKYQKESLLINEELGNKSSIAANLGNIGTIYSKQENYQSALEYFQKSMVIQEEIGDKRSFSITLNNIGTIYNELGDYLLALEYHQESLTIKKEIGDKRGIANNLNNIGSIYNNQGYFTKAINHCQRALRLAEEFGSIELQKDACQCLYDAYKAMGNGNSALLYLEKTRTMEDSLNSEETTKKLEQMEFQKVMLQDSIAKAEEARLVEEAHKEEVSKKNQIRNWTAGAGLIALLLAGGFYSRWRYVRKSKEILQTEKDRSENLLLNILPAEIAEELKEKGEAKARDFDMVSILFTDFKGFTKASEQLTAADLVAEINICFKAFDRIVDRYGIEKIKTIGDAYMAAGGLPVPDKESAMNTVLAGLDMQAFMLARKKEREALGLPAFEMRVGIHTGSVVAGIVGVKKFQYDIWGDTVNTASRMESSSEVGQVNVSEATYKLVKDNSEFKFTSRGKVEAKGKGEIEMYFVSKVE